MLLRPSSSRCRSARTASDGRGARSAGCRLSVDGSSARVLTLQSGGHAVDEYGSRHHFGNFVRLAAAGPVRHVSGLVGVPAADQVGASDRIPSDTRRSRQCAGCPRVLTCCSRSAPRVLSVMCVQVGLRARLPRSSTWLQIHFRDDVCGRKAHAELRPSHEQRRLGQFGLPLSQSKTIAARQCLGHNGGSAERVADASSVRRRSRKRRSVPS